MTLLLDLLLSQQVSIIQILIVANIGAILGEMDKEIFDDTRVNLLKFFTSWFCSGFLGTMIGMILQGSVFKDNHYLVLGGSGIAGFLGRKKSIVIAEGFLKSTIKRQDSSSNIKDDDDNSKN